MVSKRSKCLQEQMYKIVKKKSFSLLPISNVWNLPPREKRFRDLQCWWGQTTSWLGKKRRKKKKEMEETQGCILGLHLLPWKLPHSPWASLSQFVFVFVKETQLCPALSWGLTRVGFFCDVNNNSNNKNDYFHFKKLHQNH